MDLTSLVVLTGLFLGLVIGDAALSNDPLQVQITVPSQLTQTGFTQPAAEQLFAAEVARIARVQAIVPTPQIHMSSRPDVLAALVKPLNLDSVVAAVQSRVGIGVITVNSAIVAGSPSPGLNLLMVVTMPREVPQKISLSQPDGNVTALVERGAHLVAERVSPYRVALVEFVDGLAGNASALAASRDTATRALAKPWDPDEATQRAMLHNLLALLALLDGKLSEANEQLAQTEPIPGADAAAHDMIMSNRVFLALAERKPADAATYYRAAVQHSGSVNLSGFQPRLATLGGLVAWSAGDLEQAESMLRKAIATLPDDAEQHTYLADLLTAKGDTAGAEAERRLAATSRHFDIDIPSLAQSTFWVDPVHGGFKRRN